MLFETNKEKGRAGMALAIGYFGSNGYTVNIPMNDTQWYDLVIEKDGIFKTVQCKATGSLNNQIMLRSSGGTTGKTYDNVLDHPIDYLFCVNSQQEIFIIPVEDIRKSGNVNSISLRNTPNSNGQGFETYLYKVSFLESLEQTESFSLKEKVKFYCPDCGKEVSKKGNRCIICGNKKKRIPEEDMPVSKQELKSLIRISAFTKIGQQFGVSDNAVRKWCVKYNLPSTKSEINSYSDEQWSLI